MFICVCVGLGIVPIVCSIHVCSLFHEKLANAQVVLFRRIMQRGVSTENFRIKTLKTIQISWVHVHMRMRSWAAYPVSVAFTFAPFSTRNWQTLKWP
jgi:hypothetical protein